jgi:MarR family transcriptional regulator, transcriptional regulator for hemolysin
MTLMVQVARLRRLLVRRLIPRLGEQTSRPFMQLVALKFIAVEGVRSQAALAERMMVDAPAVSRMVDRLEEDGLVKRCAGEDRRCVRLESTPAGLQELKFLEAAEHSLDEELLQHLTASEMSELKRLMEKLQTGLS